MQNAKFNLFPKGKKAINDISILAVIGFIFFGTAIMIPFINSAIGTTSSTFNTDSFSSGVQQDADNVSKFNAFKVLLTILKLAFFDFGNTLALPFWLDAVYTFLAVIFITVVARNIWIGGGG